MESRNHSRDEARRAEAKNDIEGWSCSCTVTAWQSPWDYSRCVRRALFLLVLLTSISMAAAEPLSAVTGQINDEESPLPGCTVRLRSVTMTRTTVSDAEGRYAFQGVVHGEYELDFELSGYVSAQQRVAVLSPSVAVPTQKLRLAELTEDLVISCSLASCTDEAPSDRLALPRCSDYELNTALIESAAKGDASSVNLLEARYENADTYRERHRLAGALLRKTPNDAKLWNELVTHARIVVRFPMKDQNLSPEYFQWCAEHGLAPEEYRDTAFQALEMAGADPRSRPLLLEALATNDASLVVAAIEGLGKQKDFASLSLIEDAIARADTDYREILAKYLTAFDDERADTVAMKYLRSENDIEFYRARRSGS
jgi:hypothetical protein